MVIFRCWLGLPVCRWREHANFGSTPIQFVARCMLANDNVICCRDFIEVLQGRSLWIDAYPQFSWVKIFDDTRQAANMVAVGMCEYNHIQMLDTARPQIRCNY